MPVFRNSRASRISKTARTDVAWIAGVAFGLAVVSAAALGWFYERRQLLWFGDAVAHLNIARRVADSRTPGLKQIGTVWLPLPHLLMIPLVRHDNLWRTGLAGAIPSAGCFVIAGTLLGAAVARALDSRAAGVTAAALFALNPNLLYLQSIPMNETVWFAALATVLYATVRFGAKPSWIWTALGSLAALAGTQIRYEGWLLLPFIALYLLVRGGVAHAVVFSIIAGLGPLAWLAHNWWHYSNPLEFYNGPYSPRAIYQRAIDAGMDRAPGDGDWGKALLQFREAARLCAGNSLFWIGLAGAVPALWKRAFWTAGLLALPSVLYTWSVYSAVIPIFVPHLWPDSYYNTRYGTAVMPLLALGGAAWAALAPARSRLWVGAAIVMAAVAPWVWSFDSARWITWKESQVNSEARRAWTREAAAFLRGEVKPHHGIITSFGDLTGVLQEAGIPLRASLHEGNEPHWAASVARPDLFLWEEWALAFSGDKVATAILRAQKTGPRYSLVKRIVVKGAPVVEIYRREGPRAEAVAQP